MQQTVYIRDTITSDVITFTAFDSLIDKLKVLGIGKPAKFVYYVKECQSYFDNRIFDYKNLVGFTAL